MEVLLGWFVCRLRGLLILYIALCLLVFSTIEGAQLPNTCFREQDTFVCNRTNRFIEIKFQLRFGCVPHEYLDQGVRLEWRVSSTSIWQPVRYYTYSLLEAPNSLVVVNSTDTTKVDATAFSYTSTFPRQVIHCQDPVTIIEEVCDESVMSNSANLRWMQRYRGQNELNNATWSLDDIKITLWDEQCSRVVFEQDFNSIQMFPEGLYAISEGSVTTPPCTPSNVSELYFNLNATSSVGRVAARRSLTLVNLPFSNPTVKCDCKTGFEPSSGGSTCKDSDECQNTTLNRCSQLCVNTKGSYLCDCHDGFHLADNGFYCEDRNECESLNISRCAQQCTNMFGSYQCSCKTGFLLATDGYSCDDLDECQNPTLNRCNQQCVNNNGSYLCICNTGFQLTVDGFSCEDIDECSNSNMSSCTQLCNNIQGSHQCSCDAGFMLSHDGFSCDDRNECDHFNMNRCAQQCTNMIGSYQCSCKTGFLLATDGYSCNDVDECETSSVECTQLCDNTPGSFQCGCNLGYILSLDGIACEDIDECDNSTLNVCDHLCINSIGSYQCDCNSGFQLAQDGSSCVDSVKAAFEAVKNFQRLLGQGNLSTSDAANLLEDLLANLIGSGLVAPRDLSISLASNINDLLKATDTQGIQDNGGQAAVSRILNVLDQFALQVYDESEPELETEGFKLRVKSIDVGSVGKRIEGITVNGNTITLPNELLDNGPIKVASFFFKDLSNALPMNPMGDSESNDKPVSVISSTVSCANCNLNNLKEPVRYQFKTNQSEKSNHSCYFFNLTTNSWSDSGCMLSTSLSNATVTVCESNHLTHFAILLSPGINISEQDKIALQTIGYVGISISLVCLLLTVFALLFMRALWGMRNFVHVNLCVSLFVAHLIFVTAVDKTANNVLCQAIAVILHYFYMVAFMWMLMEGVVLYVALVKVFVKNKKLYMAGFTIASYGIPALYLCVTVPLGFVLVDQDGNPHYGSAEACWLRYDTHFIWAFIIPVLLTIFVNIGFFFMAVYLMHKHSKRQLQKSRLKTLKYWLKSNISLMVIMGIPWIIGVAVFVEQLLFIAYIFTIFVALQGVAIFVLFILASKQIRDSYSKWWRGKVSESEFLSKHFSSNLDEKESMLKRFSSFRTSTFRLSRFERSSGTFRSTFTTSHADTNDESTSPTITPPPFFVESKVSDIDVQKDQSNGHPPQINNVQSDEIQCVKEDIKLPGDFSEPTSPSPRYFVKMTFSEDSISDDVHVYEDQVNGAPPVINDVQIDGIYSGKNNDGLSVLEEKQIVLSDMKSVHIIPEEGTIL